MKSIVAHCRAGFEPETARDLIAVAEHAGVAVGVNAAPGAAFVVANVKGDAATPLRRWSAALAAAPPVFARSTFFGAGPWTLVDAPAGRARPDRIAPIVRAAQALGNTEPFGSVWLEHPDTNEGKALSPLARSLHARLYAALRDADLLRDDTARPRLHVLLRDGATAWLGASDPRIGSRWRMGIPRLHMPRAAPSRATLKLAEAFVTFLDDTDEGALRAGMRAVDLGAAPGGWTWQLVQRGLRVTAVDNGALRGDIARDPLVTHVRADGLRYRPRRPVDWVTCDIVEQPARIASLMTDWIAAGNARRAIFNLKLPMKKRYEEVARCRDIIAATLARSGVHAKLRVRQLYHDREEVTGYLAREPQAIAGIPGAYRSA